MMGAGISCFLAFAAGVSLGVHLNPGVESAKSLFFGVEGDGVLHRNAGQMDENRQAEKDDSI